MTLEAFERLDKSRHDRSKFACGTPELDRYLKQQANQDQKNGYAATYIFRVASESDEILAYYTLSSGSVKLADFSELERKQLKLPRYEMVPAILLGRFAVHSDFQGHGFGQKALANALRRAYNVSLEVASAFIIIDAKTETARDWYVNRSGFEFKAFENEPMRVYLPMKTLSKLYGE